MPVVLVSPYLQFYASVNLNIWQLFVCLQESVVEVFVKVSLALVKIKGLNKWFILNKHTLG